MLAAQLADTERQGCPCTVMHVPASFPCPHACCAFSSSSVYSECWCGGQKSASSDGSQKLTTLVCETRSFTGPTACCRLGCLDNKLQASSCLSPARAGRELRSWAAKSGFYVSSHVCGACSLPTEPSLQPRIYTPKSP